MSISTIHRDELQAAIDTMTGSVDIIEAAFIGWEDDQAAELDSLLVEMTGLARLERAVFDDAA